MNSEYYIGLLDAVLIEFWDENSDGNLIVQHDNLSIYQQGYTKIVSGENYRNLDWPAISPDMNPIENLWVIMVREVYASGRQFLSFGELKKSMMFGRK